MGAKKRNSRVPKRVIKKGKGGGKRTKRGGGKLIEQEVYVKSCIIG